MRSPGAVGRGLATVVLSLALTASACAGSDVAPAVSGSTDSGDIGEVLIDNTEPAPGEDGVVAPTPAPEPTPTPTPEPTPVPAVVEGARPDPAEVLAALVPQVVESLDESVEPSESGLAANRVRVAGIVSETVGPADVFAGACAGARARIARYERERVSGEVEGRFVQLTDCLDDEADPELNEQLVADVVDGDDVFAVVPMTSVAFFADQLLQEARIPYIGLGSQPGFCGAEHSFGFGQSGAVGCPVLTTNGIQAVSVRVLELYRLATGRDLAGSRVAVITEEGIGGEVVEGALRLEAELAGAEVVYLNADVPPQSAPPRTEWGDVVGAVLDSEPDVVVVDGQATIDLYAALRAAGLDADIVGLRTVDVAELADPDRLLALSGSYFVSPGVDPTARAGAEWGQLIIDMAAVEVDVADIDRSVLLGYGAADLFLAALSATPDPLSTEAFHDLLNGGWEYPGIESLVCGGWWPAGHLIEHPCAALVQVNPIGDPLVGVVPLTDFNPATRVASPEED